jgi:glutamate-1-semialdehyde 2,1-aminomutase
MNRYHQSNQFLQRAERVIPLASQTFSKSKVHFPEGVSPLFLDRGKGSHVWDIDGNEYIDFSMGLAAMTLGYQDPDVDSAVKEQMEKGVTFSLPHPLETIVAEKIVEMVPCAEMVRFGKNGSDATAGAIRLARAYTKRDHVLVGGYHGWQDWYIGSTTRDSGVPEGVKTLTHKFEYNNIESLQKWFKQFPDNIAAVILEPMSGNGPVNNFLDKVKEITHKHGAVLIFDEVVTGFRIANGGAQEVYGVTPDLTTLGKGIANGYPISAIAGKAEIMKLMEEIFFSFTFGGETLSLAASLAVLNKIQKDAVLAQIAEKGIQIISGINKLISKHSLSEILTIGGYGAQPALFLKDHETYSSFEIKTLFMQELFSRGILGLGIHNLCHAHSEQDITKLLCACDQIFETIYQTINNQNLADRLKCKVLSPLFKVR